MARLNVFLDANVLFSAALGGPSFQHLWSLATRGKVSLVTSEHRRVEAESNLQAKSPRHVAFLSKLLRDVSLVPDPASTDRSLALLPVDDAPVLDAALACGADVLVTGDLRHFGPLMERRDLGIRVRTVRAFLLEGP